jgi:hypothetical protein
MTKDDAEEERDESCGFGRREGGKNVASNAFLFSTAGSRGNCVLGTKTLGVVGDDDNDGDTTDKSSVERGKEEEEEDEGKSFV